MADSNFRITTFYSQSHFGWSETWFKTGIDIPSLADPINQLLQLRRNMLSQDVSCEGLRISYVGQKRKSRLLLPGKSQVSRKSEVLFIVPPHGKVKPTLTGNTPITFDQIRAALQMEMLVGDVRVGLRYLAGIPDQVSQTEPEVTDFSNPPTWWADWTLFTAFIIANFTIKTTKTGLPLEDKQIVEWKRSDAFPSMIGATVLIADALVLDLKSKVAVTGVKMKSGAFRSPAGTWQVAGVETVAGVSQTIYLRNSEGIDITQVKTPGTIRKVVDSPTSLTDIRPFRVGTHRRGGPFGQLRGRQTKKKFVS